MNKNALALFPILVLALLPAAWGQGSTALGSLADGYATQQAQILQPAHDLEKLYEQNLGRLREKAKAAGRLKQLLAIDAELEGFKDGSAPEADSAFPGLVRLQSIYRRSHATRLEAALAKLELATKAYREQLEILKVNLTKQDKIDEAVQVAEAIAALDKATPTTEMPRLAALSEPAAIAGFEFGKNGTARGFGTFEGDPLDLGAIEGKSGFKDANVGLRGWKALSTGGEVFGQEEEPWLPQGDIVILGSGSSGGGVVGDRQGRAHHWQIGEIDPQTFGGGRLLQIAVASGNRILGLRSDGTLALVSCAPEIRDQLLPHLEKISGVVRIEASANLFFALTNSGTVHCWRPMRELSEHEVDLAALPTNIVAIDSHYLGVSALDANGRVWWASVADGVPTVSKPRNGKLRDIVRIWSGGYCGAALDRYGNLHAWAEDFAEVGLVEKLESLKGFKDLAIMDFDNDGKPNTFALWIE